MDYNDIIARNMDRYEATKRNIELLRQEADDSTAQDIIDRINQGKEHLEKLGEAIGGGAAAFHAARATYKRFRGTKKEDEGPEDEESTDPSTQGGQSKGSENENSGDATEDTADIAESEGRQPLFKDVARDNQMEKLNDSGENTSADDVRNFDEPEDVFYNKDGSMWKRYGDELQSRSQNPNFTDEQRQELSDLDQQQVAERNAFTNSDEYANMSDEEGINAVANLKTQQAEALDSKITNFENPDDQGQPAADDQPAPDEVDAPVQGPEPKPAPPGSQEAEDQFGKIAAETGGEEAAETAGMGIAEGVLDALGPVGEIAGAGLALYSLIDSLTGKKPDKDQLQKQAFQAAAPTQAATGVDVAKFQAPTVVGTLL